MGYEVAGGLGVRLAVTRPRRLRHGRRRLVPDDGHRARDRGPGGHQGHHWFSSRTTASPRSAALSESLGSQRFGTKYRLPQRTPPVASTAPCSRSTWPRTPRASGIDVIKTSTARAEFADGDQDRQGGSRTSRSVIYVETDPLVDAPSSAVLVGRPGQRDLHAGLDAGRSEGLRRAQGRAAAVPEQHEGRSAPGIFQHTPHFQQRSGKETSLPSKIIDRNRPRLLGRLVPQRPGAAAGRTVPDVRWRRRATRRSSSARTAICPPTRRELQEANWTPSTS